jgi:hypothetical protein
VQVVSGEVPVVLVVLVIIGEGKNGCHGNSLFTTITSAAFYFYVIKKVYLQQ